MVDALIDGERRGQVLADLAKGEPGIGKSSLVADALAAASQSDMTWWAPAQRAVLECGTGSTIATEPPPECAACRPDRGSAAAGSEMVMVSPPPGVFSGSSVPPIASVKPRDTVSPSPTPVVLPVSPSR
jgi:hypothetical protein